MWNIKSEIIWFRCCVIIIYVNLTKNGLKFLPYWPTGWENQVRSNWQGSALYCLFIHLPFKTFNTELIVLQCVAKYVCCYLHTFVYKSCWKNPLTQHVERGKIIWKKHYAYKLFFDLNENDILSMKSTYA